MAFLFQFEASSEDCNCCIPMEVRLKLDLCGVKLQVSQWQMLSQEERSALADLPYVSNDQLIHFAETVKQIVLKNSGTPTAVLPVEPHLAWENRMVIPSRLQESAFELGCALELDQWAALTPLQRFALIKLVRPGHENRNFLSALQEFGLV
jgi:hypothetical protein